MPDPMSGWDAAATFTLLTLVWFFWLVTEVVCQTEEYGELNADID